MKYNLFVLLLILPVLAMSHSGGTDGNGCHTNHSTGEYHCHNGGSDGGNGSGGGSTSNSEQLPKHGASMPANPSAFFRGGEVDIPSVQVGAENFEVLLRGVDPEGCFIVQSAVSAPHPADVSAVYNIETGLLEIPFIEVNAVNYQAILEVTPGSWPFKLCLTAVATDKSDFVAGEYNREDWNAWIDADNDCQDTREEVLYRELNVSARNGLRSECTIDNGWWLGFYEGDFLAEATEADIDHVVPLSWAHHHGGANWSSDLKEKFANDQANLVVTDASVNQQKSDKSPLEFVPSKNKCEYITIWNNIVEKYGFILSPNEEHEFIELESFYCGI